MAEGPSIAPDDSVLVERYVRAVPEPPPIIEQHVTLRPVSVLPDAVPLRRLASQASIERYAFFVSADHKIDLAMPRSHKIGSREGSLHARRRAVLDQQS